VSGIQVEPIRVGSVAEIAYDRIRALIVNGSTPPNTRLHQGELATAFGISRTSVREALHRLAAEELVEFRRNHGFFVAAPLHIDSVVERLEVRLFLEPGTARLAAERRTDDDIRELARIVKAEAQAKSPRVAHDRSREFHMALAHAARNSELAQVLDSLWTVDVGRQLLARRVESPTWQAEDVAEHEAIATAVAERNADRAAELMHQHVAEARSHWAQQAAEERGSHGS
jgi:GntR family transcriptional repressor for pyruvate dehydrogenase complex